MFVKKQTSLAPPAHITYLEQMQRSRQSALCCCTRRRQATSISKRPRKPIPTYDCWRCGTITAIHGAMDRDHFTIGSNISGRAHRVPTSASLSRFASKRPDSQGQGKKEPCVVLCTQHLPEDQQCAIFPTSPYVCESCTQRLFAIFFGGKQPDRPNTNNHLDYC